MYTHAYIHKHININRIKNIKISIHIMIIILEKMLTIPFPPLAEQTAIVKKVEVLLEKVNALETEIKKSEAHAQMLMQAVLKEAFET